MTWRPPRGDRIRGTFAAGEFVPPNPIALRGTFSPDPPPRRRLLIATLGVAWSASKPADESLRVNLPASRSADASIDPAWPAPIAADLDAAMPWGVSRIVDIDPIRVPWAGYRRQFGRDVVGGWPASVSADAETQMRWMRYLQEMNSGTEVRWPTSVPADRSADVRWSGPYMSAWRDVPHVLPVPTEVQIAVVGGGLRGRFPAGDYVPPPGNMIRGQFGGAYIAPPVLYPGTSDHQIPYRSVRMVVGAPRELQRDEAGRALMVSSAVDTHRQMPWSAARPADREVRIKWVKYSRALNPGWGVVIPPGPITPGPGEQIVIGVRRAYIVRNEVLIVRKDDLMVIHGRDLAITIDSGGLVSFSARVSRRQRDAVRPAPLPVEIIAWVNGVEFWLLVEKVSEGRGFGEHNVAISGRGVAAALSADHASPSQWQNAVPMTAQQVVAAALDLSGFEVEWLLEDWLLPAGAMNLYGAPLDVASYVAGAVGAVLQGAWDSYALRFAPSYPVKPWEFADATPEIVIPSAACQVVGIEPWPAPAYNRVVVSGALPGEITGNVKITGTAGDRSAPAVTHPLISQAAAARQRGIAELGAAGDKSEVTLQMQVPEELGVIDVNTFIEFNDGGTARRGLVRGNRITTGERVRQSFTVEVAAS